MPRRKLTEEQKWTVARFNAMKHGFAARSPIIPEIESEQSWKRHHKEIRKSFSPEGYFEDLLVRRLATALWEVDRLTAYQVAATMSNIKSSVRWMAIGANYQSAAKVVGPDPYKVEERAQGTLLPTRDDLESIMRYGSMLHRQWVQILHELEALQARRRGEVTPLARVDFSSPPNLGPHRSPAAPSVPSIEAIQLADGSCG